MTVEEFNKKYEKYLEDGHYGLAINNIAVIRFLDCIFKDFIKIPDFTYSQIKLKFGMARVYTTLSANLNYIIEQEIEKLLKLKNK